MTTQVVTALIALVGVIISVLASLYMTRRRLDAENRKLDVDIQNSYSAHLLERRHTEYPKLYQLLSTFIKELQFGKVTKQHLANLRIGIEEWDSAHSILVNSRTQKRLYDFRKKLITELLLIDEKHFASLEFRDELRNQIGELETALRNELGVYVVEFNDSRMTRLTRHSFEKVKQGDKDYTEI